MPGRSRGGRAAGAHHAEPPGDEVDAGARQFGEGRGRVGGQIVQVLHQMHPGVERRVSAAASTSGSVECTEAYSAPCRATVRRRSARLCEVESVPTRKETGPGHSRV